MGGRRWVGVMDGAIEGTDLRRTQIMTELGYR